jgi:hypothetical protein
MVMAMQHTGKWRRLLGSGLLGVLFLAAAGCGGKGTVSGLVRFKGQPLPNGEINFLGQSGNQVVVKSQIKDGAYKVDGIPTGPVKITVRTFRTSLVPRTAPLSPPKKAADMPDLMKGMQVNPPEPGEQPEPPGTYVPIPERYADPEQSGLDYTVTRGSQTKDLDLGP